MKNLSILIILCLGLISQLHGQGLTLDNNESNNLRIQKGQSEIGLGLKHDIVSGINAQIGYRYALKDDLLLRANLDIIPFSLARGDKRGSILLKQLEFAIGVEKHHALSKRWSVYYGLEIGVNRFRTSDNIFVPYSHRTSLYATALTGVKYQANKRLSFFIEGQYTVNRNIFSSEIQPSYSTNTGHFGLAIGAMVRFGKK